MSKNSITITLDFDDKGKPAKISADIDNLTKAIKRNSSETEKATKTKRDFNREEKGVAGATNNTTKAFSKMSSGISSGVVKAYATLAANVFAVTAAFGALQRAAAVTQLEQGLIAVGNAGGQNLLAVAKNLQGITDNAISAAQAMEATALAASAGFSTEQLERLTKVAKGASQALGRNMADALDRLVRGTAKLEPEILDELGIMVRLDDALKDYGETLGKKATELTVFERRMAFLNTTIEQGEAKFNAIADAVDTNPYNQLSATFDNLTKNGLKLVNTFLTPFLDVLNSSQVILAGVGTLFAGSFSRQMIPSLYEASEASKQLAEDSLKLANSFINTGSNAKNLSKEYKDFVNSFKDSVVHLEDIYDAFEMLEDVKEAAYLEDAKTQESILNAVSTETKRLTQSVALLTKSRAESAKMAAYDAAQTLNIVKGYEAWKDAIRAISEQSVAQITAIEASGRSVSTYRRALLAARTGVQALSFSLKMLGVAFMAAIPYIGMAVTAFGLLKEAWGYFTKPDAITSTVDEVTKSFASFAGISNQLDNTITSLSSNTDIYLSKLKVEVGVLDQLAEGIKKVKQAEAESESFKIEAAQKKLTQAASKLTADDVALLEQGGEAAQAVVDKYERLFGRNWAEVYRQGLDQLNKAFNETTTLSTKGVEAVIAVSKSFITQATASNVLGTATRNSLAQLEELTDLLDRLNRAGASTSILDGVIKQILNLRNAVNLTLGNIESLTELTEGFGKAISSEIKEVSTPFSGVATNLEEVIKVFSNIKTTEEFSAALSKVDSSLAGVLQGARDSSEVITILTGLKTAWEDAGKATESAELSAASYKRISDSYKDAMKESPEAIQAYYDNLNAGIRASAAGINKQIQALSLTEQNSGRILALERERDKVLLSIVGQSQIDAEIAALKAENAKKALEAARKLAEFELNANRELLSILSDTVTYKKEMLEAEEEMLSLRLMQEEGTSELSGIGELKLFEALKAQREELIQSEYEVKLQQVELEYDLLEFKLEVLAAEAKVAGKNDLANKILGMKSALASMEKQASDSLLKGYQAAMAKLSNTPRQLKIEIKSDISKLIEDVQAKGDSFADVFSSIFENFDGKYSDVFKQLGEFPQIFENSAKAADTFAAEQAKLTKVQETITKAKEAGVKDTSKLEAEYKNKSVALTKAETQSKISTWAAYGAAVGTTLNAVAETQDQTSREGFEVAKALNIAAAVVNTAAGITAALANPGGPPGVALAAVVAAMGAAQIATIASTEFGDSGAPSAGGGGGASTYSTYGGKTIGREGTQLGTSDSVEKTNELLEEIHAREYYELHSIAVGIDQLNKQLIGASENIYQNLNLDNLRSWYADPNQRIYESELRVPETTLGSLANINAPLDVQYWSYDRPKHKESELAWNNLTAQMLADPSAKSVPAVISGILKGIAVPIIEAAKLIDPTADLQAIYDFVIEPLDISLLSKAGKALTAEELEAELMSITSVISDIAIDSIIGEQIRMYQQIDEGLLETAVRVASTRVIVADLLKDLGYVEDTSDVLITVSESFASIAGGIEEFQQISSTFSDSFYSDVQKFEKNQLNLTKIFEGIDATLTGVNVTLPDTKEGLLELLSTFNIMADESLGITEEMALANRQALVDIMQSTEQLSEYYDYLESRNAELLAIEVEKLRITGQASAALTLEREAELKVLDPLVAAKQEELWIIEDLIATQELEVELLAAQGSLIESNRLAREAEYDSMLDTERQLNKSITAFTTLNSILNQIDSNRSLNNTINDFKNTLMVELPEVFLALGSSDLFSVIENLSEDQLLTLSDMEEGLSEWFNALNSYDTAIDSLDSKKLKLLGREEETLLASREKELAELRNLDSILNTNLATYQEYVYALEDLNSQLLKATEAYDTFSSTFKSQITTLLGLIGDSEESLNLTRSNELAGLPESLAQVQMFIWNLEDTSEALEKVNADLEEAKSTLKSFSSSMYSLQSSILDKLGIDDPELLRASRDLELLDIDPALHGLQELLWTIEDLEAASNTAAEATNKWVEEANSALDAATDALTKAFKHEKELLKTNFEELEDRLNGLMDSVKDNISSLESTLTSLSSAQESLKTINRKAILESIANIKNMAAQVKIGDYSGLDSLDSNLNVLTNDNEDQYAQFEDYQKDFMKAKVAIDDLSETTDSALSIEQRTLSRLDEQLMVAKWTYELQAQALDDQLNTLLNIDTTILSIEEATNNFITAQKEAEAAKATAEAIANEKINTNLSDIHTALVTQYTAISDLASVRREELMLEIAGSEAESSILQIQLMELQKSARDALINNNLVLSRVITDNINLETALGLAATELNSLDTAVTSLRDAIALTESPIINGPTPVPSTNPTISDSLDIQLVVDEFNKTGNVAGAISYAEALGIPYSTLQAAFSRAADAATPTEMKGVLDMIYGISGLQGAYDAAILYGLSGAEVASLYDISTEQFYANLAAEGLPRFASGGMHTGGWRLVGETGPELEYTGSSHIYNRQQANSLFNTEALENELRGLREDMRAAQYQIAKNTGEFNRILQRWDGDGLPEERVVV